MFYFTCNRGLKQFYWRTCDKTYYNPRRC